MSRSLGAPVSVPANGLVFSGLSWGQSDGPLVLLLHGFPQHSTSWTEVGPRLADVGIRVIALDQRGYSPSARPSEISAYALPHLIADVVAMIDALGGALHLAGHDWGGVVGWHVASRYPDLVRSWTALSTPNPIALNEVLATDPAQRARFGYMLELRAAEADTALLAGGAARLRSFYGGALSVERENEDAEFFAQPGALSAALNWYRAMSRDDSAGLPRVAVPTTFVWGTEDIAFGRAAAERTTAFVDAPYQFVALEGASHWLPDEDPDAVAEAIAARVLGR